MGGADTCDGGAWATTDGGGKAAKAAVPLPYDRAP